MGGDARLAYREGMGAVSFLPQASRRRWLAQAVAAAAWLDVPGVGARAPRERQRVVIGLGREESLYHLPLTVARQLGFFADEGLEVRLLGLGTPEATLQALEGRRVDVVSAPYLQVVMQRLRGRPWQAFVLTGRAPMVAMGVSTRQLPDFKHVSQLRGQRIGVAAQASLSRLLAQSLLAKAGLSPAEVTWVELPAPGPALQEFRSGRIQALSHADPTMTQLEQRGELRLLADARTVRGTADVFAGPLPSTCLFASKAYVDARGAVCQGLTNAVVRALRWLQTAELPDIVATVPPSHALGDRALYLAAFFRVRDAYSIDGLLGDEAVRNVWRVVQGLEGVGPRPETAALMAASYTNALAMKVPPRPMAQA
jgi:NitT/TauT family transport system substrate-binding protein